MHHLTKVLLLAIATGLVACKEKEDEYEFAPPPRKAASSNASTSNFTVTTPLPPAIPDVIEWPAILKLEQSAAKIAEQAPQTSLADLRRQAMNLSVELMVVQSAGTPPVRNAAEVEKRMGELAELGKTFVKAYEIEETPLRDQLTKFAAGVKGVRELAGVELKTAVPGESSGAPAANAPEATP